MAECAGCGVVGSLRWHWVAGADEMQDSRGASLGCLLGAGWLGLGRRRAGARLATELRVVGSG